MIEAITLKGANVSAFQDAMIHDAVFKQNGVFRYGSNLEAEIKTNNLVSLKDGIFVFQGRYARIKSGATEDVRIKNGRSGVTRKDLIVLHFETDGFTETMDIHCITGEENGNVPAHATGDSLAGTTTVEMPLYVVSLNGLSIESVTRQFDYIEPIGGYLRGLAPTNLLINGDFQCNQRGQADYNYNSNGKYGLDMWQNRQGNYFEAIHVRPKVEGVEIELNSNAGAGIRQIVQGVKNPMKKTFTACWEIDGVRSVGTVTLLRENEEFAFIDNGVYKVTLSLDSSSNQLRFAFWIHNSSGVSKNKIFKIKYIDLFEGDVAYPHVKEDYALALQRCKRYIQALTTTFPFLYKPKSNRIQSTVYFESMEKAPSFFDLAVGAYDTGGQWMNTGLNLKIDVTTNYLTLQIDFPRNISASSFSANGKLLLTCEPL